MSILTPPKRGRRATTVEGPDPVDIHVGARVRLRRTLLGLSQSQLGDRIGHNFQQIQKYEKGANRISASTLHRLSNALDVPVGFFFDDLPGPRPSSPIDDSFTRLESLALLRNYYQLPIKLRRHISLLLGAMVRGETAE